MRGKTTGNGQIIGVYDKDWLYIPAETAAEL